MEESNFHSTEWCWAVKRNKFIPVLTDLEDAIRYILKMVRWLYKIDCSSDDTGAEKNWVGLMSLGLVKKGEHWNY